MDPSNTQPSEILAAKVEVERAKQDLAVRLRAASRTGRQMMQRTLDTTKPLLVAVAALGAGLLAMGLLKLVRRRPQHRGWSIPEAKPSLLGSIVRSALVSLAASLARRLVDRLTRELESRNQPARAPALPGTARSFERSGRS